jgi:hypothetical protein
MKGKRIIRNFAVTTSVFLCAIPGCELINPAETVPSYLHIKDFTFSCEVAQGYPSEKITDGWIYINNEYVGAFELPATIPVLSSGATEIIVFAGIKENGISGTGMIYPFYSSYTVTKELSELVTDTITASCTYKPAAAITFIYRDDFEIGNSFHTVESEVELTVTTASEHVFEGARSAIATMTGENDTLRISTGPLIFPTQDKLLFLEIDYKCDISYQVWLNCTTGSGTTIATSVLTITPKDYWNKIYVNLNPKLQFYSEYDPESYQLEFRAVKPQETDTASIYFDNLKIIRSN